MYAAMTRVRSAPERPERRLGLVFYLFSFISHCEIRKPRADPERPRLYSLARRGPEPARGAQRRPDDKERLRGSPGEGAPEQAETEEGEAQKEAPERSRSRLGLVFQ